MTMKRPLFRPQAPVLLLAASFFVTACDAPTAPAVDHVPEVEELPVIASWVGEFDGHQLTLTPYSDWERSPRGPVGVTSQPLLDTLDGGACFGAGCGTGTDAVWLEQVASTRRTITNGTAGTSGWSFPSECGGTPTTGMCVQIQLRNLYPTDASHVYVELTELMPTGSTTSVFVPPPATNTYTGVPDWGLTPPVTNGLWRYGLVGRTTPAAQAPAVRWAFHGSTPTGSSFQFRFVARVRGLFVRSTVRASLADGTLDDPTAYYPEVPGEGTAPDNSAVSISRDGRYVAFASSSAALLAAFPGAAGTHVFRKDLETGALELVSRTSVGGIPSGACTVTDGPDMSADGNVVVFGGAGCALDPLGVPAYPQIYAHDVTAGTTSLLTRGVNLLYANQPSTQARVSASGDHVVYASAAFNLDPGHPGGRLSCYEVYRQTIATGDRVRASRLAGAAFADASQGWATTVVGNPSASCNGATAPGFEPDISGDGSLVVFTSGQRLDADPDLYWDIYVYDHATSASTGAVSVYRATVTSTGAPSTLAATNRSRRASIAADGSLIVFNSVEPLLPGVSGFRRRIWARPPAQSAFGAIELVTHTPTGAQAAWNNGPDVIPVVSDDGRFVAFWSSYADLTGLSPRPPGYQMYVCDRGGPVPLLDRCWAVSLADAGSGMSVLNGTAQWNARPDISTGATADAPHFVAYLANPSSWGNLSASGNSVFVSPWGDPRPQTAFPGVAAP